MSTDCINLFHLARNKLQLSFNHKDRCSLHRWVLLKNSITNSPTLLTSAVSDLQQPEPHNHTESYSESDDDDDDVLGSADIHNFMFPDAGNFVDSQPSSEDHSSEAQWLDSLLETLGDDDDDDYFGTNSDTRASDEDEDEQILFSPSASPMSSSDDLPAMHNHPYVSFVSYPIISPYPPFHPPLASPYAFISSFDPSSLSSLPHPYEDPLPFSDDVDDMPVPDAIEDTSDDESDSPPTPSMGGSRSSLFADDVLLDTAASIPLPPDPSRLSHGLRVYDEEDPCFSPFDPVPSSADDIHSTYNLYQEC